jgi:hypothetical protein
LHSFSLPSPPPLIAADALKSALLLHAPFDGKDHTPRHFQQ